jgi:ABC-type uncharacterized transport system, auxiliary component
MWPHAGRVACALAGAALMLAACAIDGPARIAPAVYDLGDRPSTDGGERRIRAALMVPTVGAPPWLESTRIVYRLNFDDPKRLRAYRNSRWVATPALLLTEEVRSRLAVSAGQVVSGADGGRADYVLRMELQDFQQSFDTPDSSHVVTRVRATLVDRANGSIVAQHTFSVDKNAAPNAAGAASALAESSIELVENLLDWAAQNLKNTQRKPSD